MKKIFSLSMLIVGTMIGAGFASGKEIASFFGENISPLVAVMVGIGIFLLCFFFCSIGRVYKCRDFGDVNQKMFGKIHIMTDIILLLNSLIVLSGMLSGMNSLLDPILPISPAYSIISGVLCAVIVSKGINGLLKGNSVIVPFIVLFIVLVCCFNIDIPSEMPPLAPIALPASVIYVCMNIMLACTVLVTVDEKPKTVFWASLIAALVMTALMLIIILTLNGCDTSSDMPLIDAAKSSKLLYYVAVAAVATSIFTTMMTALNGISSWLAPLTGDRFAVASSLLLGLIVSNMGFSNVVAYLYPLIGLIGLIYVIACVIAVSKRSLFKKPLDKRNGKVHDGGKKTKNYG